MEIKHLFWIIAILSVTSYVNAVSASFPLTIGQINTTISVWNQNGSNVFLDDSTASVGIGTTSPQNKLEVIGAATFAGSLNASSINTTGSAYFAINSGRVGINSTNPAHKLTIGGTLNVTGNVSNNQTMLIVAPSGRVGIGNPNPQGLLSLVVGAADGDSELLLYNGEVGTVGGKLGSIWFGSSESSGFRAAGIRAFDEVSDFNANDFPSALTFWTTPDNSGTPIERMRIRNTGNVGIGTNSSNYLLQVASGTAGRSVNLSNVLFINGTSGNVGIGTTSPTSLRGVTGPTTQIYGIQPEFSILSTTGNVNTSFYHNWNAGPTNQRLEIDVGSGSGASVEMVITSSGNVGINTTVPTSTLQVQGTLNVSGVGRSGDLFVASSGNVGIGTANAGARLHILESDINSNNAIRIQGSSGTTSLFGDAAFIRLYNPSTTNNNFALLNFATDDAGATTYEAAGIGGVFTSHSIGAVSGEIQFITRNAGTLGERVRITSSGNVGIGTTNPAQTLTVQGRVNISQNLTVNNSVLFVDGTSGNVGIGTSTPLSELDVRSNTPTLTLSADGVGLEASIDFARYDLSQSVEARIETENPAEYSNDIVFSTKNPGAAGNALIQRMMIHKYGVVGINQTDPIQTLDIKGTLSIKSGQSGNAQGLFQNAAGNIGIGETAPTEKLVVYGGSINVSNSGNTFVIIQNTDSTASSPILQLRETAGGTDEKNWDFIINGANSRIFQGRATNDANDAANAWIQVGRSGTTITNVSFPNGNVGIGTTTPTEKLTVLGNVSVGNFTARGRGIFGDTNLDSQSNITLKVVGDMNLTGTLYYSALTAQSPHAFIERDNEGNLKSTTFCVVSQQGNVLEMGFDDLLGIKNIGINTTNCMNKETLKSISYEEEESDVSTITYQISTYESVFTKKQRIVNSTYGIKDKIIVEELNNP